jgi:hypothetical protein
LNGIFFEFNHFYFQILSSGELADCIIASDYPVTWYKNRKGVFGKCGACETIGIGPVNDFSDFFV